MLRRDLLSILALTAVGGFVFPTWLLAEAEKLEVTKTDEVWRRLLTPAQYQVLRHEATEPAGSSPLLDEHRKGVFACAGSEDRTGARGPQQPRGVRIAGHEIR